MKEIPAGPLRKQRQLHAAASEASQARGITTGLDRYRLVHQGLPELSLESVDTSTTFLGHALSAPLIIASMTGGTDEAGIINRRLAIAAQETGIAMGVGSQRVALENGSVAATFQVRGYAPDIMLFANLGAVQLNYGYGPDQCRRAIEMIEGDALFLHINPMQESVQVGGDTDFCGLLGKIGSIVRALDPVPVLAKEVGNGVSERMARQLIDVGVAGIDVGGAGGTAFQQVEELVGEDAELAAIASAFMGWGIPLVDSLRAVRSCSMHLPLIATGGIRSGVDVAKALALGANLCGMASPFLRAAMESEAAVVARIRELVGVLRRVMFLTAASSVEELRGHPEVLVRVSP
ncbi:MAG: type 2 isopentenyl-diphosphate Delta-isomerase [Candidatus Schekmanbacteria bacterium]|nr:type 2 isopentenyl-diphosphate Delta-isomerase [Candidatus Schekmanbacteria bacterium]